MPRSNKEILDEIACLEGVSEIIITQEGKEESKSVEYIEGYMNALIWCISTTDDEGEA
jgi:hypothetical protein